MVKPPSSAPRERAPAPPVRAARLPADERRESILEAALPLFALRGFQATTTRDLARAAGVTEPILYRHFPGKADLFGAVVARAGDRLAGSIEEIVGGRRGAAARLRALSERLEALLHERDAELRVLNGAAATHADPETMAAVRDVYARLGGALSRAFVGGGLRRGVTPETAGHMMLELGLGTSLIRPLGVPVVAREGYRRAVLRLLLASLTKDREQRPPRGTCGPPPRPPARLAGVTSSRRP